MKVYAFSEYLDKCTYFCTTVYMREAKKEKKKRMYASIYLSKDLFIFGTIEIELLFIVLNSKFHF